MKNEEIRALRSFDAVWRRVTESRGAPAPLRPEELMPKRKRDGCRSRRGCCQR